VAPLPRRLVLWAAIAVGVAIVAALAYAWTSEPLEAGNIGAAMGPPESTSTPTEGSDGQLPGTVISFVASGRVAMGVEVRNALLVPITITGLAPDAFPSDALFLDAQPYLLLDPNRFDVSADALRPFQPVTLAGGESVFIAVAGHFPDCQTAVGHTSPGSSVGYEDIPLSVEVLGVTRSVEVRLMETVQLQAPAVRVCPG